MMPHLRPGTLHHPARWRMGALGLGGAACAAVLAWGAPGRIEHTGIVVQGADPGPAVAAMMQALRPWWTDPAMTVVAVTDGIRIDRRVAQADGEAAPAGSFLASRAVAALADAAPPARPVLREADPLIPELSGERGLLEARRAEAERSATTLSAALTGVARDTAAMQALDSRPPEDAGSKPLHKMLADLQLHRIDLAARYAADFPGIAIADTEIAGMQALLAQQTRRRPVHPAAGALDTLRAEQGRLQMAMTEQTDLAGSLASRIAVLDGTIAARLVPVPRPAPPPIATATIVAMEPTMLPDPRPALCGGIGFAALAAAWLMGRRRRPGGLAGRIEAIERLVGLPVLRCLDVDGGVLDEGAFAESGERSPVLAFRDAGR